MNLPYRDDLPDRVTSLLLPSGDDEDDEKARGSELNRVHFANRNDFVEWKKFSPKTVRRHTIRTATPVHLAILKKKPLSTINCAKHANAINCSAADDGCKMKRFLPGNLNF